MVTVQQIKMFFQVEQEGFARELYGRWDRFFRLGVEEVADRIFTGFDSSDEVIRVGHLEVDLGVFEEEDFYGAFPRVMEERLAEVFSGVLRHRESYDVRIVSLHRDGLEVLLTFLLQGYFPAEVAEEYHDLHRLLRIVLEKEEYRLGRGLRQHGEHTGMRRRLVRQFTDRELERIVEVTEPSEAVFIKVYTRSLITSWSRLRRPEISSGDYRNVVWEVVWAYLLCEASGFFSRKQLVRQTVVELARYFNLGYFYLLNLLTKGLKRMVSGWLVLPELSVILSEIRREELEQRAEKMEMVEVKESGEVEEIEAERLRRLLSQPGSCRRLLDPMREEEIYRLVEVVMPSESRFVIAYAQALEREKERGMLEGRAGPEFRILKWEFLFTVMLNFPAQAFQRKFFVWEVILRIAVHYNVDARTLLLFLCGEQAGIPEMLRVVLLELYEEQLFVMPVRLAEALVYRTLQAVELERLRYTLLHPQLGHRLLRALPEEGIYRLVRALVSADSGFVISYARVLEREQRKGLLEGRQEEEFRVLKWEFIFMVVLSAPASAFSRKQFVRSVLQQIAAHYNLTLVGLLDYFSVVFEKRPGDFPAGVWEVLLELRREEGRREQRVRAFTELDIEEAACLVKQARESREGIRRLLLAVRACGKLDLPVLQQIGGWFAVKIWACFCQPEVSVFFQGSKEFLWGFLEKSVVEIRQLYEEMKRNEGVVDFLVREFGEKKLMQLLQRAGIRLQELEGLTELAWKEALEKEDAEGMESLLEDSPCWVRRKMKGLTAAEKVSLDKIVRGKALLQRKWLKCISTPAFRQIIAELERLEKEGCVREEWVWGIWAWVYGGAERLSREELLYFVLRVLAGSWSREQRKAIYEKVWSCPQQFPGWADLLPELLPDVCRVSRERKKRNKLKGEFMKKERKEVRIGSREIAAGRRKVASGWEDVPPVREEERFYVSNAGIVILAPYFPRLFERMGWMEKGIFTDEGVKVRAVFAMQYLAFGLTEFPETELVLNKLLVDWQREDVLPLSVEFGEEEKEVFDSLLKGAMAHWSVMEHTSADGFRGSFLIRNGVMADIGDIWQLTVEEKSYDVLLNSLPWTISPVKFPWMKKPLYVNWR